MVGLNEQLMSFSFPWAIPVRSKMLSDIALSGGSKQLGGGCLVISLAPRVLNI
jgi:hypothetical protein